MGKAFAKLAAKFGVSSSYVTALRNSIVWLTSMKCAWSAEEAAEIAGVAASTAASYCGRLVSQAVLCRVEGGRFRAGPAANAWRKQPTKTHEGGNSRRYQAARSVREEVRAREWHEQRLLTGQEGTERDNMDNMDSMDTEENVMDAADEALMSADEVAAVLAVSARTVRRMAKCGQLQAVRVRSMYRVKKSSVYELLGVLNG